METVILAIGIVRIPRTSSTAGGEVSKGSVGIVSMRYCYVDIGLLSPREEFYSIIRALVIEEISNIF